jgi:hypothetical protein
MAEDHNRSAGAARLGRRGRAGRGHAKARARRGERRTRRRAAAPLDLMNGLIRQRNAVIATGRSSVGGIDCHGSGQAWLAVPARGVRIAAECTLLVRPGHDGRVGNAGEVWQRGRRSGVAAAAQCDLRHIRLVLAVTSGHSRTATDSHGQQPPAPRPRPRVCVSARAVTQWKYRERGTCRRWRACRPGHRPLWRHRARPYRPGLTGGA